MHTVLRYFATLPTSRLVLWCYLVWYVVNVVLCFDPNPAIWLNSLGISAVIGAALLLSVRSASSRPDRWQTFRLFAMPFGVSSFAALIKGRGYIVVFPPSADALLLSVGACSAFVVAVLALKRWHVRKPLRD